MRTRADATKPRTHDRCQLSLPVVFSWRDSTGRRQQGKGFTRNLSAAGLYLATQSPVPVGAAIRFETFLPPMSAESAALRMQGEGVVLRVEPLGPDKGWMGVATTSALVALSDTQRRYVRQKLEIPLTFSWKDQRGRRRKGSGVARDVSPGGFFLVTRDSPPLRSSIAFEAYLPPIGPEAPALRLKGEAQVLRVESEAAHEGQVWRSLAAATEKIVLQDIE